MALSITNYLERISFRGKLETNLQTLTKLHRKHIQSIPFENLDIHQGRKIYLDVERIEEKIISNGRGGFCYELNGLFCALLKQLGFDVKMISARVYSRGKFGNEFDHMVLIVNLAEDWLVDVGFGDNFQEPIRLVLGLTQEDPAGYFRIQKHDSKYLKLESSKDDLLYSPNYIFTQIERRLEDYVGMCEYHQTSPESSFTKERVCTIATMHGRMTLRDQHFIETLHDHKTVRRVVDDDEYQQILGDRFGIQLDL